MIPVIFVLIWSTGFIVGKAVVPHADLQLYLLVRFGLTALVMGVAALVVGADWPRGRGLWTHLMAGESWRCWVRCSPCSRPCIS